MTISVDDSASSVLEPLIFKENFHSKTPLGTVMSISNDSPGSFSLTRPD